LDVEPSSSNRIHENVLGCPFHIGQRVCVIAAADETAAIEFLGRVGTVAYFEYECGCGQTYPKDPMIGVLFGNKIEEFWKEELAVVGR
jgi:hypothetical protein